MLLHGGAGLPVIPTLRQADLRVPDWTVLQGSFRAARVTKGEWTSKQSKEQTRNACGLTVTTALS